MPNVSKIEVDEIGGATGTTLTLTTGHVITGSPGQFQISGGATGQVLTTDGTGNLTFADAGSSVTIADAPPSSPSAGDLWWESDTGILKVYYNDGTTSQWVDATPQDAPVTATATAVSDQANTSTGYFDVPAGTTAQRPGSPAAGNVRVNTDLEALEHYIDGAWVQFGFANPIVTSISPTTAAETGTTITVTGTNFKSGATIRFIGNGGTVYTPGTTTFVNATQMTATTPNLPVAGEPFDVKVINPNASSSTLEDALDVGGVPTWTTAAGNLATIYDSATGTHATLVAGDPDGTAVTFAESTNILTGGGFALNSTTGVISGDPTNVSSQTTYNFDVDASDGVNNTNRSFNIIVNQTLDGSTSALANSPAGLKALGITTNGLYWINDGVNAPYRVYCGLGGNDATGNPWPDSAGWVRFWWYGTYLSGGPQMSSWPGGNPATLGVTLPGTDTTASQTGFNRIPPNITPTKLLVYGLTGGQQATAAYQLWDFDSGNSTSNACLASLQSGTQTAGNNLDTWNATSGTATGSNTSGGIFGTGGAAMDWWYYTSNSGQLTFSLDDDSGHHQTAFMSGYDGIGYGVDFCSAGNPSNGESWSLEMYFKIAGW